MGGKERKVSGQRGATEKRGEGYVRGTVVIV